MKLAAASALSINHKLMGKILIKILKKAGWAAGGVIKNSIASWVHSMIGNVAHGSWFAKFQSIGAKGLIKGLFTLKALPWIAGAAAVGSGGYSMYQYFAGDEP